MNVNGSIHETPALRVERADQNALVEHWAWIRAGLLDIKRKNHQSMAQWLPEHVRIEIEKTLVGNGATELWMIYEDGPVGFVITTAQIDQFVHLPLTTLVWLVWTKPFQYLRLMRFAMPLLEDIATKRGYLAVEHVSGRRGWEKISPIVGYLPVQTIFRKMLVK